MSVRVDIVYLEQPCSACFIIYNLILEIMKKLKDKYDFLDINYIEIKGPKDLHQIEGLEVEKFPAIIIEGEQVSAGTVPDIRLLEKIILNYKDT